MGLISSPLFSQLSWVRMWVSLTAPWQHSLTPLVRSVSRRLIPLVDENHKYKQLPTISLGKPFFGSRQLVVTKADGRAGYKKTKKRKRTIVVYC